MLTDGVPHDAGGAEQSRTAGPLVRKGLVPTLGVIFAQKNLSSRRHTCGTWISQEYILSHFLAGRDRRNPFSAPEIPQDLKVAVGTRRTLARGWFALQWKVCFKPWLPPPAPVGAAGTHIFQLSPAWEMHMTCNIFEQDCILQSCILRFSSA